MRYASYVRALPVVLIAACGRIGFDPLAADDTALVAVGGHHSCAAIGGRVVCWGDNVEGQLGRGTLDVDPVPRWVPELANIEHLASASDAVFAIDREGAIWSWGHTGDGSLGDTQSQSPRSTPMMSPAISGVVQISGGTGVCARAASGTMTCWGDADAGQLAIGSAPDFTLPVPSVLAGVTRISIGTDHGCAIAMEQLWCFGCAVSGQLGVDVTRATDVCKANDDVLVACSIAPVAVAGATNPREVSAGRSHTCAIFADERVRCWGSNVDGALGDGTNVDSVTPVVARGLGAAFAIATGRHHSCALLADGSAWCWGRGAEGQLGNGSYDDSNAPVRVDVPVPLQAIHAQQSGVHTCAAGVAGDIWCWGYNLHGQLGSAVAESATPIRVELPPSD